MTSDEQERENMKWQLVTLIDLLEHLPVTVLAMDNVEADDVLAYLSQLITSDGGKSIIYSTDKDLFQLASDSVTVYNPIKKKTYSQEVILEDYGIHPKHFHFFRALNGDKSDNIDGIKGVGETTLKKYLPEIADPTAEISVDVIRQKYMGQKKIPKMISNIIDNEDIVKRNLMLMDLHEGIMSTDAKMRVSNLYQNNEVNFDKPTLTKKLIQCSVYTHLANYDQWVVQTFMQLNRFSKSL
jgi:5'-3' exonuclease